MKKWLLLTAIVIYFSTTVFAETTIRITNGEWEPYLSEYSYQYGLASHIVSEAFKLEGIHVEWNFFNWKRSYEMAKEGKKWEASAVWWSTEETKQSFLISAPVVRSSIVFFHLKSRRFHWQSVEDLKGLVIGFTRGYDYGNEFMTALKNKTIVADIATTDEQNFKKLLAGRNDIFPNDPVVGYSQIRNTFSPEQIKLFTHHPKEFEKTTLNLIISKKSPNAHFFLEKFNAGLKKLTENGRLAVMWKDLESGKYDKKKLLWKE